MRFWNPRRRFPGKIYSCYGLDHPYRRNRTWLTNCYEYPTGDRKTRAVASLDSFNSIIDQNGEDQELRSNNADADC